eukprot:358069-Chlamydomonas_euryale.AAC.5
MRFLESQLFSACLLPPPLLWPRRAWDFSLPVPAVHRLSLAPPPPPAARRAWDFSLPVPAVQRLIECAIAQVRPKQPLHEPPPDPGDASPHLPIRSSELRAVELLDKLCDDLGAALHVVNVSASGATTRVWSVSYTHLRAHETLMNL